MLQKVLESTFTLFQGAAICGKVTLIPKHSESCHANTSGNITSTISSTHESPITRPPLNTGVK